MKIKDLFTQNKPIFSFEFFPPKTPEAEESLYKAIERLKPLHPNFISVTCGAMGTTKTRTAEFTASIKEKLGTESMAHVTCVASTKDEIHHLLTDLRKRGIENVLALRGDAAEGTENYVKPKNGFGLAIELIQFIREKFGNNFSIGTAGYPEVHVECKDKDLDLKRLKEKVDMGGEFVITQLFFNNENFLKFRDDAKNFGIQVPIIPGIMPITNTKQLTIFADKCGVHVSDVIKTEVNKIGDDKQALEAFGIELATKQCEELLKEGVPGIHFYTLNRSKATRQIFENLNLAKRHS